MSLSPLRYDTNPKRVRFADEMLERVKSQPGIRSVGIAWTLPFMGWPGTPVQVFGRALMPLNERPIAAINNVDAGYFHTLQIPLRRGRLFDDRDGLDTAPVAIINETFARQFWSAYPGGDDPIGQRVLIGANTTPVTIVGIVGDIFLNPSVDIQRSVYRPYRQAPPPGAAFAIRTEGNPIRVANSVREQLRSIDRDQPIIAMRPLEEILDTALGQRRLVMTLLQLFAGLALILAMVGVYGVVAHIVTQRTREVGVYLALGARPTDIIRALIGQAFWIVTLGIAIGFAGAFGLTRFLKAYLFQVTPTEITTFIAVAVGFLIVASASTYLPLRRATRIDPMTVLRHE
jgi:predicted permease